MTWKLIAHPNVAIKMSSVQELERKKRIWNCAVSAVWHEWQLMLGPVSTWRIFSCFDFKFRVHSTFVVWCGQPRARTATQFMNIFASLRSSWCSFYRCWFAGAMFSEALIAIYLFAVHNRLWQKYKIETKKTRRDHHHHNHHRQPPIHQCLEPNSLPAEHGWTIYLLWKNVFNVESRLPMVTQW